jgi:hypothetical protein
LTNWGSFECNSYAAGELKQVPTLIEIQASKIPFTLPVAVPLKYRYKRKAVVIPLFD